MGSNGKEVFVAKIEFHCSSFFFSDCFLTGDGVPSVEVHFIICM